MAELHQTPFESEESVVDVSCGERKRLSKVRKLSYLSGGKSSRSIESSARPNEERNNASSDIEREILVEFLKPLPLIF